MSTEFRVTYNDILAAENRISSYIHETPVFTSSTLNRAIGRKVFFKAESFQKTGSFKARGALNAVLKQKAKNPNLHGVITHSSGNHGQALAWASTLTDLDCTVVVTKNTPKSKCQAITSYGANIVYCEPTYMDRIKTCDRISREKNIPYISSSDDYDIMAGQGTIATEFLNQVPQLDAIFVPVSGGGMAAGIAVAAKAIKPDIKERYGPKSDRRKLLNPYFHVYLNISKYLYRFEDKQNIYNTSDDTRFKKGKKRSVFNRFVY